MPQCACLCFGDMADKHLMFGLRCNIPRFYSRFAAAMCGHLLFHDYPHNRGLYGTGSMFHASALYRLCRNEMAVLLIPELPQSACYLAAMLTVSAAIIEIGKYKQTVSLQQLYGD